MDQAARLENLKKMAAADPDNELAHFSLGKLHLETASFEAAAASLRRTLELNPQHSLAHQLLGEALLSLDRKSEAIEVLEAGVALAHAKGELMPRDRMRELLAAQGVALAAPESGAADGASGHVATATGATGGSFVCRRCNKTNPPLAEAPFRSEMGDRIQATICAPCWKEWMLVSVKVINEFRLNLMSPKDSDVYDQHMREFLGL